VSVIDPEEVRTRTAAIPNWKAMGRPKRVIVDKEGTDPKKEIVNDLLSSEAWDIYLHEVIEKAKIIHKNLCTVPDGEHGARQAALRAMYNPIEAIYKRSSFPIPQYLRVLLTGDFDGE
jgi:hypothetical protein